MLAPGRTLSELLRIAALVYGEPASTLEKANGCVQTLAILKRCPGPWLAEPIAERVRAAAVRVVRGQA